jgi:hypothetical protein
MSGFNKIIVGSSGLSTLMSSDDGLTWQVADKAISGNDYSTFTSANRLVFSMSGNTLGHWSSDGLHYFDVTISVEPPTNSTWYVAFNDSGLGVGVSSGGSTGYSPVNVGAVSYDFGKTWTKVTLPLTKIWTQVKLTKIGFVAVASSGETIVTSNGTSWSTSGTIVVTPNVEYIDDVYAMPTTTGNEFYLATSRGYWLDYIWRSFAPGNTWNKITLPVGGHWKLAYNNGVWLGVSSGVSAPTTLAPSYIIKSLDQGLTWTYVTSAGTEWITGITGIPNSNKFMLLCRTGSKVLVTSDNGTTWTTLTTLPGLVTDVHTHIVSAELSVSKKNATATSIATGAIVKKIGAVRRAVSTSITNFFGQNTLVLKVVTAVSTSITNFVGHNTLVLKVVTAISSNIASIFGYNSTFRKTIQAASTSVSTFAKNKLWGNTWSIIYSLSKFIGVKASSALSATSTTGVSWATGSLPTNKLWTAIASDGTSLVTLAKNSNNAASSTNGTTWTSRTLPTSRLWSALSCMGTTFIAVAYESNMCAKSVDGGITWTEYTLPQYANWTSIANNGTRFVTITDSNIAAYSTDGQTWTQTLLPANLHYNCISWGLGQFTVVASGPTNQAARSTDGNTWLPVTLTATADWTNVGPGVGDPSA